MESKILKSLVVLGVPGVALGVFYLLLKGFNFQFSEINSNWAAIIAIIFLVVVGSITLFALNRFAPTTQKIPQDTKQDRRYERAEVRMEDWLQEALNHANDILQCINGANANAREEFGLLETDRIQIAILKALTPEYSPDKLNTVTSLNNKELNETLNKVWEAFRAVRMAQMDLAHGAPPISEEYEPMYVVQWYSTQITNFRDIAKRLLSGN